jgi:hypothetical protein
MGSRRHGSVLPVANSSFGAENSAPAITDVSAREILGYVSVGTSDYIDLGGCRVATKTGIGLVAKPQPEHASSMSQRSRGVRRRTLLQAVACGLASCRIDAMPDLLGTRRALAARVAAAPATPLFVFSPGFTPNVALARATTGTFHGANGRIQSAAIDTPRYEYDPVTLALKGLLCEPTAITNIMLYSGDPGNAAWGANFVGRTINAVVAPDGTTSAAKLVPTASGTAVRADKQTMALAAVPTLFVRRLKSGGYDWGLFSIGASPNSFIYFNLATGVVGTIDSGTGATCRMTLESDGYYRCEVQMIPAANAAAVVYWGVTDVDNKSAFTGDGRSGIYVWGGEVKPGASFGDSYIPTTSAPVTRAADVISLNMPDTIEALTYSFGDGTSQPSRVLTPGPAFQVPTLSNTILVSAAPYALPQRISYVSGGCSPNFLNGPINQVTSIAASVNGRTRHRAAVDMISVISVLDNSAISLSDIPPLTELGPGHDIYETEEFEYPLDNLIGRALYSGAGSVVLANGQMVFMDEVAFSRMVPAGAYYYSRRYRVGNGLRGTNTAYRMPLGFPTCDAANGEFNIINADTVTSDATGSTGIPAGSNFSYRYPPMALLGRTNARTFYTAGDSTFEGSRDSYSGNSGDLGYMARAVGPLFAYVNGGVGNDRADRFLASHDHRLAIALYASDVVFGYGVNDFANGRTPTDLLNDGVAFRALFLAGVRHYVITLPPFGVTGTYDTAGGQTTTPALEAKRLPYNAAVRAGIPGVTVIDIAAVVEDPANPGKFRTDQGVLTPDGTHLGNTGNVLVANSGVIQAAIA